MCYAYAGSPLEGLGHKQILEWGVTLIAHQSQAILSAVLMHFILHVFICQPDLVENLYDEDVESMNTRNPVEFEVNGVNLAEVQEGEVTVTNLHSSNGPDFIFHLKFSELTGSCQAHARLKCVYFPITKGKESIDSILETLRNDGYEIKENFDNFPRVSIRRLGRLLPDARWGPLPFMEAKYRKGYKAEFFRRCCKRVKCFVAEVDVEARDRDGKLLSYNQLEKQYYDWIKEMHDKYDVEMDGGDDEPTLIIDPKCKERLGISNDVEVIRVHRSISRKGKTWRRGDHLKILPGLQGDVCGEFTHALMPIDCSDDQGCRLDETEDCISPSIYIQESVSFPCKIMDDASWNQMLKKRKEKAPASIELIRNSGIDALGLGGDLPYEGVITAGYQPPHEIVAVLRPQNYTPSSTGLLDHKYIVKNDELEMAMEVRQLARSKECPAKLVDKRLKKPSLHNDIHGLYVFPLREASCIFTKSGVYQFIFSVNCQDSSVIQQETTITVCPDSNSRRCLFSVAGSSTDNAPVDIRLGYPVRCLAVKSVDLYGNKIPFLDTSGIIITILDGDDVLAQVDDVEVELSSDSFTLNVMDFLFETSKLDILRPKYEAKLKISSSDNEFSGICPCKVKPGLPSTIDMDMSLFSEENLIPGRVIDNVLLEVNGEGCIDLCGALRVLGGFGSEAYIEIFHHEVKIFSKIFHIAIRELKAVNVPESCPAGSFLDIIFEVSDSNGLVDESIDGLIHTLNITSTELPLVEGAQYAIKHGRCVISHLQLPHEQGKLQVQPFDLALTNLEDGPEPILSNPISSDDSLNLLLPCQLTPAQPSHLVTYVKGVVKKTTNKVGDTCLKIKSTENALKTLYSHKDSLEEEIDNLKDDMLSVVCKTPDAAKYIEKYNTDGDVDVSFGIHHEAAALGVPIKSRFAIICLDAIEPYKGGLMRNSPQKELNLAWPFPHFQKPKGFKGFAVNMINLSDENLNITTSSGDGLPISLDGGVIKGKGKLLLGYSDPNITFPIVSVSPKTPDELKAHKDVIRKTRELDDKMKLLEAMKTRISKEEKVREELLEEFNKRKRKFDKISEIVTQPCGNELVRRTAVKAETLD
ncbi:hypothetical protein BAE44_0013293 [Dichanthelium oligosanthes]|uniref:Structural maintenance of chromosomes flexible hinge domain-containing protein GMI1 n=1 Tax=Dichanthelium oligosanthes TaxID=888268 RepID=A0A1E5VKN6_9POAL|nr:hypothetical protein BAE44_0013293 [Dichanthelium oligosanthes]